MPVESMDKGLNRRFVDMPNVRRCLSRLLALEDRGGVDESEGINHDFPLHRLYGIDDDGNRPRV